MTSLADELAADLDSLDSGDETHSQNEDNNDNMITDETELEHDQEKSDATKDIRSAFKLLNDEHTKNILKKIEFFENKRLQSSSSDTADLEEYDLTVEANILAVEMNDEIAVIHKFIRDQYAAKFPELESLVPAPLDFIRTVKAIGLHKDITKAGLGSILPSATIMVVTVEAAITKGQDLSPTEWKRTEEACDMAIELDKGRTKVINYVESRMTLIAPNLTAVVGSATAAKLITEAGGLSALTKIPACNLQVLGNKRKTNIGLSKASVEKHTGYIYDSDFFDDLPVDKNMRHKITRIIANKCALAARFDYVKQNTDSTKGQQLREEINNKIEKLLEPLPTKHTKALPVPDEGPKKRRGGKRVRKQKEAYAMTELRTARNRMAFNEAEEEVFYGDESEGLGMAAKNSGKLRAAVIDTRSKVKRPKLKTYHQTDATSGLATSLAFGAESQMRLVDPTAAAARAKKLDDKYFGDGSFSIVRK